MSDSKGLHSLDMLGTTRCDATIQHRIVTCGTLIVQKTATLPLTRLLSDRVQLETVFNLSFLGIISGGLALRCGGRKLFQEILKLEKLYK